MDPNFSEFVERGGVVVRFQFPSNGKVDPNEGNALTKPEKDESFQFPSNGKVDPNSAVQWGNWQHGGNCFNSLQTGKWILTSCLEVPKKIRLFSFNSLQTGKWILTMPQVSLPDTSVRFNSLQTGKWILTRTRL